MAGNDRDHRQGTDYVVYVVAVTSMKVRTDTKEEAVRYGQAQVMSRLQGVDRNVYIPKVAVMTADDDQEQKQNIAEGVAPWLGPRTDPRTDD